MTTNSPTSGGDTPGAHAPIPYAASSKITLAGIVGSIATGVGFIVAGETTEGTAMLIAALGGLAAWYAGRSVQAKAAIEQASVYVDQFQDAYSEATQFPPTGEYDEPGTDQGDGGSAAVPPQG